MTETPVTIQTPRFTIEGKSRAGNETYFRIRELGIALDIGRCPDILVGLRHIFVTHAHLDHALGIPFYAAQRRLQRLEAGNVYLPLETIEDYTALMKLHEKLEGTEYPLQLVGMSPGDRRPLRRDLDVVAHRSTHRVVCNAWEFVEKRRKLREEYSDQDGPALAQLREEGVDFSDTVEKSLLFYTGDTDRRILETGGAVFSTEVLMIECSFTAEGEEERAAQYAHIHLRDIYEFADQFQNELVVLTHFSLRDSPESIHRLISRTCPAALRDRLRLALPGQLTRL